jgi:hypothetical protein
MTNTTAPKFIATAEMLAQAAEYRAEARGNDQAAYDSFERCDTDGFLSQWAHGQMATRYIRAAEILEAGGCADFIALFDLEGNLVPAKYMETQYGWSWALLEVNADESIQRIVGWFNPSKARNAETKRKNNAKKGYALGTVRAACSYDIDRGGVVRTDGEFSSKVEILDDGC